MTSHSRSDSNKHRTRLAPSPTGALHLGNARTFVINWLLARVNGWAIQLRIDDLDGPRVKAGAADKAIEDLQWLGLDWDDGPVFQSHDLQGYTDGLESLHRLGAIYPCRCTRKEIEAVSAPQEGVYELRYPGTCRDLSVDTDNGQPRRPELIDSDVCWRVRCPGTTSSFDDQFAGPQSANIQQQVGDFVVLTKAGLPSYQLATVMDDAHNGMTAIVRGDDLVDSTFRQEFLRSLLGFDPPLRYWHLPMVVGEDGRRLAKRHGDSRIRTYREQGVSPQRVLGLLRSWCGGPREPCSLRQWLDCFRLTDIPADRVTFSAADDQWLLDA